MDIGRFDDLVRSLAALSRRSVLGLALGGALGPLLALTAAEARKKKGKRKKKKKPTR